MIGKTGASKSRIEEKICVIVLMLLSFSVLARASQRVSLDNPPMNEYLPLENEIMSWTADGPYEVYEGEDLYLYMDGGASVYQEYGFIHLLVQNYRSPNAHSLTLEIYEMVSPAAAYGLYTFKRSDEGSAVRLGQEGCTEDYYLNFWKGHFLITLTCDNERESTDVLLIFGKAVDTKIKDAGSEPELTRFLPREGLRALSIQYYRGYLGLFNSYPFSNRDIFSFKEGIRGEYTAGYSVYILKYGSSHECQNKYVAAKDLLLKEPRYRDFKQIKSGEFTLRGPGGAYLTLGVFRQYVVIVIDKTSSSPGRSILRKTFRGLSESVARK